MAHTGTAGPSRCKRPILRLFHMLGAKISVRSELGQGADTTIASTIKDGCMSTVDIVIIWPEPDETPLSFVFKFLLKPPIYRAEYIPDINVAYERCIRQKPHIIIVKRKVLSNNDGFALCAQFRADDRFRLVPN
jgi:hypothetical protein